jgi:hypothetical protein
MRPQQTAGHPMRSRPSWPRLWPRARAERTSAGLRDLPARKIAARPGIAPARPGPGIAGRRGGTRRTLV